MKILSYYSILGLNEYAACTKCCHPFVFVYYRDLSKDSKRKHEHIGLYGTKC